VPYQPSEFIWSLLPVVASGDTSDGFETSTETYRGHKNAARWFWQFTSTQENTQRHKVFGDLIYTETLSDLSRSKNWTQNVQPSPWLHERAVK